MVGLSLLVSLAMATPSWAAAGDLDPSWGGDGTVISLFGATGGWLNQLAFQSSGKMIAAGFDGAGVVTDFAVARYNDDGTLDTTFGAGAGYVTTDFDGTDFDFARGVAVTGGDKIILGGSANGDLALVRYQPSGSLDLGFGTGGKVTLDIQGAMDSIRSVLVRPSDSKITVAGYATMSDNGTNFVVARFRSNGVLDTTFGVNGLGYNVTNVGGGDQARGAVFGPNGTILVAGYTKFGTGVQDFAVVRYRPNGTLDPTFGTGGMKIIDLGAGDVARDIKVQADNKIVVCGYTGAGGGRPAGPEKGPGDFAVVRLLTNGTLDTSFGGGDGIATFDPGGSDHARACAIQPDGKIILSGDTWVSPNDKFATVRFNSDGTVDGTFGTGGMVVTDFGPGGGDEHACDVKVLPDGRIIAVGPYTTAGAPDWALVRYLPT
jgi:uncharacterized delta-60 repeat protein